MAFNRGLWEWNKLELMKVRASPVYRFVGLFTVLTDVKIIDEGYGND